MGDVEEPSGFSGPDEMPNDLSCWCIEQPVSGWVFEHPLLRLNFPLHYREELRGELEKNERKYEEHIEAGEFERALALVETDSYASQRLQKDIAPKIPNNPDGDQRYWEMVFQCLRNRPSTHRQQPSLGELLESSRDGMENVFCGEDYSTFEKLSESIPVWRGVSANDAEEASSMVNSGYSWSLSKKVASRFANRDWYTKGTPFVAYAQATKDNMIAYFPSAGEDEVLVRPGILTWEWDEPETDYW